MSAQARVSDQKKIHRALLDSTLPLLVAGSPHPHLRIVAEDGATLFDANGDRAPFELVLSHAEVPALERVSKTSARLAYSPERAQDARAALLALGATQEAPIAADSESLAQITLAQRVACSDIPVLIEGPTGTGKEVLSRFIHERSGRSAARFVPINCAAMPEAMLEAQLFGHRKGAFTGASEANEGLFRAADKGSLLLDEIGEMPLALQSKLLRALQEGEVLPLGATRPVRFDTRVIACTNRRLAEEVAAGRFREDLFYRLNVFPLRITALRARREDIAPLAFGMLLRHACVKGKPCWLARDALTLLETHSWPGNVRELENVIRRAILLAGHGAQIEREHIVFDRAVSALDQADHHGAPPRAHAEENASLSDIAFRSQAQAILAELRRCGGHRGKTARRLGISERTLRYRLASMRESGLLAGGGLS